MHTCTSGTFLTCPFPFPPPLIHGRHIGLCSACSPRWSLWWWPAISHHGAGRWNHQHWQPQFRRGFAEWQASFNQQWIAPIPARLLKRVENGLFVEMAELSPSYSDSSDCSIDDQYAGPRKRPPVLKDIMDWVGCFEIYIATVSRQKPKRVPDLLGYQRISMGASLHCREGKWLTYDRRLRLKVSASNATEWSTIDITIWNTTFPERAIYGYHSQGPLPYQSRSNPPQKPTSPLLPAQQPICLDWINKPNGCSCNPCCYAHVCYRCVHNPGALDRNHKASACSYRDQGRQRIVQH